MSETRLRDDLNPGAAEAIVTGRHGDPFAILGPHEGPGGGTVVRAFAPHAAARGGRGPWPPWLFFVAASPSPGRYPLRRRPAGRNRQRRRAQAASTSYSGWVLAPGSLSALFRLACRQSGSVSALWS